jgi:hypothetical protein
MRVEGASTTLQASHARAHDDKLPCLTPEASCFVEMYKGHLSTLPQICVLIGSFLHLFVTLLRLLLPLILPSRAPTRTASRTIVDFPHIVYS